jgi:DNA-binding MarR family transcriptional regulator
MATSAQFQIPATGLALQKNAPYVGALLPLTYQVSRRRSLDALKERGFTDLNQSHLNVLMYPMTHGGMRPIDMAEITKLTKQAMNYLIGELEKCGYLERRLGEKGDRRLIHLTRRGWLVFETIWKTQIQLEKEWEKRLGKRRFEELMAALRELSEVDEFRGSQSPPRLRNTRKRASR